MGTFDDLKGKTAEAAPAEAPEPGWFEPGSKSEALVRGAANAASLGLGKYAKAGLDAVTGRDTFGHSLQGEMDANASAADKNPITYGAGSVVGGLPATVAAGGGLGAIAKNALIGGVQGGADSGSAEGALKGAAVSGGLSGALAGLGRGAKAVGDTITPGLGRAELQTAANRALSGEGSQTTSKAVRQAVDMGQNPTDAIKKNGGQAAFDAIKSYVEGKTGGSAATKVGQAAVHGAANSGGAALLGGVLGGVGGAAAAGAGKGALSGAKTAVGLKAADDLLNGGAGKITPDIGQSVAAQAGVQKVKDMAVNSDSPDASPDDFGSLLNYLNHTDPNVRAATNPSNPLNRK